MFVHSDGLLYIVKQTGIEPRELTKDEKSVLVESYKGQAKQYRYLLQLL